MTCHSAVLLIVSAIAAGLCVPNVAAAQECRRLLDAGVSHFSLYHKDPVHVGQAAEAYLNAAKDADCAYEAYWRLADLYLCWGTVQKSKAEKIRNFKKGAEYASLAIKTKPGAKEGHYYRAVTTGSIVQVEGPMKNLLRVREVNKENGKALAIDPGYSPALLVEARFMADMPGIFGGSDRKAETLFRKAIDADPQWETPYVSLAEFLFHRKRFAEAGELLKKVLADDFPHRYEAPWVTIDKPKAQTLTAKIMIDKPGGASQ